MTTDRSAEHKAKLATDPRFAGWLGLMTQDDPDPAIGQAAQRLADERRELMRQAYQRAIDLASQGHHVSPVHLAFARKWVAENPPLARPLGTGDTEHTT